MHTLTSTSDAVFDVLDYIGTVAFAVSGAMVAIRRRMDLLGIVTLGLVTAIGGGTVRDVLLGLPVSWIDDPWPVAVAVGSSLVTILLVARVASDVASWRSVLIVDAAGLAVFTILGADVALDRGVNLGVAVLLGVLTGAGGGVVRDVLADRTPLVLTQDVYALAAGVGATMYVLLVRTDVDPVAALWLPVLVVLVLRLLAVEREWSLPRVELERDEHDEHT